MSLCFAILRSFHLANTSPSPSQRLLVKAAKAVPAKHNYALRKAQVRDVRSTGTRYERRPHLLPGTCASDISYPRFSKWQLRLCYPSADRFDHLVRKHVYLIDSRIHVRRDAETVGRGVQNRRVDDAMLRHQPRAELAELESVDADQRNGSGILMVERGKDFHAWTIREQPLRPPVAEITEPSNLAVSPDASVKCKRGRDRVVIRGGMRADLFVFANVRILLRIRRHERPEFLLLVTANIEEACADRSEQPLVKAGAVVVGVQIVALEREMRKRMRSIDQHLDPTGSRELYDLTDGHDLPREVGDVRNLDHACGRSDCRCDSVQQISLRRRRNPERDLLQHYSLASRSLVPRRDHARIILIRDHDLVAALQVETEDHDLVRLRCVPRNRHLFHVAAEFAREIAPYAFDARLEYAPHVLDGKLVGEPEVADHCLQHVTRRRRYAAVVEVDHRSVGVEQIGRASCRERVYREKVDTC